MTYTSILVEAVGDVAVIRFNDQKTLNAATPPMVEELLDALSQAAASKRAVMMTGIGRAFCSGANLGTLELSDSDEFDGGVLLESHFNPLMLAIRDLPLPIITAVNGPAVGVGSTIALAGDLILAADRAYFMQAFRHVGVIPDAGTAYLLTRAIGRPRAMELMMLGEKLTAQKALEWGLINRVLPPDELDSAALALATELAAGPTRALAEIRKSCWHALDTDFAGQLAADRVGQRLMGLTADHREGVTAFFEKHRPVFVGK